MKTPNDLACMIRHLSTVGLNLFACLPGRVVQKRQISGLEGLERDCLDSGGQPLAEHTFLLVGNYGPAFWAACQASEHAQQADPVDEFSQHTVIEALKRFVPDATYNLLYPAPECHLPLQDLGAIAGWHRPSPLGIGMHPKAGLWFAYRALVLVDAEWELSDPTSALDLAIDHCARCETQDCISACPSSALVMGQAPDLLRCCNFRIESNSSCEEQCLARNACPVFSEHRYSQEQIRHHYTASLDSLRRYIQQDQGDV